MIGEPHSFQPDPEEQSPKPPEIQKSNEQLDAEAEKVALEFLEEHGNMFDQKNQSHFVRFMYSGLLNKPFENGFQGNSFLFRDSTFLQIDPGHTKNHNYTWRIDQEIRSELKSSGAAQQASSIETLKQYAPATYDRLATAYHELTLNHEDPTEELETVLNRINIYRSARSQLTEELRGTSLGFFFDKKQVPERLDKAEQHLQNRSLSEEELSKLNSTDSKERWSLEYNIVKEVLNLKDTEQSNNSYGQLDGFRRIIKEIVSSWTDDQIYGTEKATAYLTRIRELSNSLVLNEEVAMKDEQVIENLFTKLHILGCDYVKLATDLKANGNEKNQALVLKIITYIAEQTPYDQWAFEELDYLYTKLIDSHTAGAYREQFYDLAVVINDNQQVSREQGLLADELAISADFDQVQGIVAPIFSFLPKKYVIEKIHRMYREDPSKARPIYDWSTKKVVWPKVD